MSDGDSTAPAEYRPIDGYPGYRVGSDGTVWTCFERYQNPRDGRIEWCSGSQWTLLRTFRDSRGRKRCELRDKYGVPSKQFIHRLVLLAFAGPCPPGKECCHGDGDTTNNRATNLRWDTPVENAADRSRHGTQVRGQSQHLAKLTEDDVRSIRLMFECGESLRAIAKRVGVTPENVSLIVKRKTWKHV